MMCKEIRQQIFEENDIPWLVKTRVLAAGSSVSPSLPAPRSAAARSSTKMEWMVVLETGSHKDLTAVQEMLLWLDIESSCSLPP